MTYHMSGTRNQNTRI